MTPLFRPRPLEGESISSIAIRAGAASESTLPAVLRFAGQPYAQPRLLFGMALRGKRTALHEIALLDNWTAPKILSDLSKEDSLCRWISFKSARFCPVCAEEGMLPWLHDVDSITACTKHGLRLIDRCESCGDTVTFCRLGLNRCHCGAVMKQKTPAEPADLLRSQMITRRFQSADIKQLWPALKMDQLLRERYEIFDIEFDAIFEFLEGRVDRIVPLFLRLAERFPGLPARLLVCPLSKIEDIDERAIACLIEQLNPAIPRCAPPVGGNPFLLNLDEAATVLGLKEEDTKKVIVALNDSDYAQKLSNKRGWQIDLSNLYRKLYVDQFTPGLSHTEVDGPLLPMVIKTLNGDFRVAEFDPTKRLRDMRVSLTGEWGALLCATEAARYLKYTRSSIECAASLDLVKYTLINERPFFSKEGLDEFSKKYVSSRALTKTLEAKHSEVVTVFGLSFLTVFSGDGANGNEHFYLRDECEQIDLHAGLKEIEGYPFHPIYPMPINTAALDGEGVDTDYIRDDLAADIIGTKSRHSLCFYERTNLLVRAYPPFDRIGMRRFYSRASVEAAKGYIQGLTLLKEFATEAGATPVQLRKRHRRLLDAGHYQNLRNEAGDDLRPIDVLKEHFLNYWGAESAAKHLGVSLYSITNWRTWGHLETIQQGEAGFLEGTHLYKPESVKSFPGRWPDKLAKARRKFAESAPAARAKEKRGRRRAIDAAFSAAPTT